MKSKKMSSTASARVANLKQSAKRLNESTGTPVSISKEDWTFLKAKGQFTMRTPHDDSVAFLGGVPVRRHIQ